MNKTTNKNTFPEQIFVQLFDDGFPGERYLTAEESLPGLDDNEMVATYKLVSVKTMKVKRTLV